MPTVQTISPAALKELYDRNPEITVLDVRTPAEFQSIRASFAKSTPIEILNLKTLVKTGPISSGDTIYLFCAGGTRANMAAEKFIREGFENVYVIEGGLNAWVAAGFPVIRQGRKVISVERQVRITAGSLIVLGVILGFKVNPAFFGLSAFVGCGLIFAGITDTCGMALVLARMPWNQASQEAPKTCTQ